MTITQAKALRVGQRLTAFMTDPSTGAILRSDGYVCLKSRSGIVVKFDAGDERGYRYTHVHSLHILAN